MVVYPADSQPLLVSVADPYQTAWLPDNDEKDYMLVKNPRNEKYMVTSPTLMVSHYATCQCKTSYLCTFVQENICKYPNDNPHSFNVARWEAKNNVQLSSVK